MLTIDDINSINEKYGQGVLFFEFDVSNVPTTSGESIEQEGVILTYEGYQDYMYRYKFTNFPSLYSGIFYAIKNGEVTTNFVSGARAGHASIYSTKYLNQLVDKVVFVFHHCSDIFFEKSTSYSTIIPISNTMVPVVNGEFNSHFYIRRIGERGDINYYVDDVEVPLETDDNGTFLRLPSANDCIINIGFVSEWDEEIIPFFKITFKEFKTLPILSIPTIYKGNTQTIQLFNDTEEITEFQAYYKGELLTDNKITLPYDADDYIDITVDLLDNRYPNSTLKLKAPTQMYSASTQSEVESAISQGITTLQVGDTETEVSLNGIDLTQVTLVDSNIQLTNSTLNNCTILNSQYTDNGANTITNTVIRNTDYTNTSKSVYENTSFYNSSIQDSELQITGTIYECELTNSLIISDGTININNNTFTGIGSKTYFPSHLYLTGDYIVSGNTFNLTGTFTELQFNMCLIKATNDFNVGDFINKNTFQLNITYESEPTNTLYYNIVDDDKIRARRLS